MAHVFPASGRRHYGTDSTQDSALNDANAASASLRVARSGWFAASAAPFPIAHVTAPFIGGLCMTQFWKGRST